MTTFNEQDIHRFLQDESTRFNLDGTFTDRWQEIRQLGNQLLKLNEDDFSTVKKLVEQITLKMQVPAAKPAESPKKNTPALQATLQKPENPSGPYAKSPISSKHP